jgi:hypothetical protein
MNRATFIEKFTAVQQTVEQRLEQLYRPVRQISLWRTFIRLEGNTAQSASDPTGNKAIDGEVISSYQGRAEPRLPRGFRSWEHLLRIHE